MQKEYSFCSALDFPYFANKLAKLLHLGIKKERVLFVLHSIFRNFAGKLQNTILCLTHF